MAKWTIPGFPRPTPPPGASPPFGGPGPGSSNPSGPGGGASPGAPYATPGGGTTFTPPGTSNVREPVVPTTVGRYDPITGKWVSGAGDAAGIYQPGWQTPISDPGAAVRNTMRQMGIQSNPFNQSWQNLITNLTAGILPQFFTKTLQEGQGGGDLGYLEKNFGDFINARLSGNYAAPTMGQSQQNLGSLNSTLRAVTDAVMGMDGKYDMSTPKGRALALSALQSRGGSGGVNPLQMAIASQMLSPDDQAAMFLGSYLPGIGPGLTRGLAKVIAPQQQVWEDYQAALSGQTNKSFLDMLIGSFGR